MDSNSLLNVSDLLSGGLGVLIQNKLLKGHQDDLKVFGKHVGVSIASRMFNAPGLPVGANNQQYVFAAVGGALLEMGPSEKMLYAALTYAASNYGGDYAAMNFNLERQLIPIGGYGTATPTSQP